MNCREFIPVDRREEYQVVRSVVEHEDDLINHRNSWLILAQSFLLVAYVQAGVGSYRTPIFLAGVVSTFFCGLSIWAAILALHQLRRDCHGKYEECYPYLTSPMWRHLMGLAGAALVSPVFIIVWVYLQWFSAK